MEFKIQDVYTLLLYGKYCGNFLDIRKSLHAENEVGGIIWWLTDLDSI